MYTNMRIKIHSKVLYINIKYPQWIEIFVQKCTSRYILTKHTPNAYKYALLLIEANLTLSVLRVYKN